MEGAERHLTFLKHRKKKEAKSSGFLVYLLGN